MYSTKPFSEEGAVLARVSRNGRAVAFLTVEEYTALTEKDLKGAEVKLVRLQRAVASSEVELFE